MKRLFSTLSTLSDETEPGIKRARRPDSSLSSSLETNESIHSSNSQNEHNDNDLPEIVHQNSNSSCQQVDETISLISDSDSDDDQSIPFISSPLTTDAETVEEGTDTENEPELIDLTEDEPISHPHEHKSSVDVERCPICLETLSDLQSIGVNLTITQCHHVMCSLCSQELLSTSSRCPLCRKNISSTTLMPYCILT